MCPGLCALLLLAGPADSQRALPLHDGSGVSATGLLKKLNFVFSGASLRPVALDAAANPAAAAAFGLQPAALPALVRDRILYRAAVAHSGSIIGS